MGHKHWILLGLCLTLAGGTEIIQSVEAMQPPQVKKQKSSSKKSPRNKKTAQSRSLLQRVFKIFEPKIKNMVSRGTTRGLCPLMPGLLEKENNHIWSTQPLFLWRGQAQELQISDELTGEILWQQSLAEQQYSTVYNGPALQPGKYYVWMLLNEATQKETVFKIIDSGQRSKITAQLNQMSRDIEGLDISSKETELGLLKAGYFAEQEMWSDTLTTALQGQDASSREHLMVTDQLSQELCDGDSHTKEATTKTVSMP